MRSRLLASAGAAVLLGTVAQAAASPAAPRVWVAGGAPLVVRGSAFRPGEHVKLSVATRVKLYRTSLDATGTGGFVARFKGSIAGGCTSVVVVAAGSAGSRATERIVANDCGRTHLK